jgi:predicted SprT family Zn-dependent metalloprotease
MFDPLRELYTHYQRVVDDKFEGRIPRDYRIAFNGHLRRLTGRITYAQRLIEISRYHYSVYGLPDAVATLEHELLHLYLHEIGRPSGHTPEFKRLAAARQIRVFHANDYPKNRLTSYRYLYECPACHRLVSRVRRVRDGTGLACGICCRAHASGAWDERYALQFVSRVRMV